MAIRNMAETTAMVTTEQKRPRQEQQTNSSLKIFLNRHGHCVDFFCATLLVCVCLIVLLPRVHDSFTEQAEANHTHVAATSLENTLAQAIGNEIVDNQVLVPLDLAGINVTTNAVTSTPPADEHDHSHHHHHGFPAGEFLVCIGFFVFYCVGFSLEGTSAESCERGDAILRRRSTSTTCCSSTICPPIQLYADQQVQVVESNQLISSGGQVVNELTLLAPRASTRNFDDDCLMLLNPHHQHHTHSKHHDTAQQTTSFSSGNVESGHAHYGSIGLANDQVVQRARQANANNLVNNFRDTAATSKPGATIIVDEIRITSKPSGTFVRLSWPRSIKMLLLSMILTAFLVFFDLKMHGWLTAIKVFRACSTGALLYVAFFIMLPRDRVGCNSCQEEEN